MDIPENTDYGVWMRCPNAYGGKDWLGFVTDGGVISCWGRTGQVRQSKVLWDHSPQRWMDLLMRKVEEKRRKGYDTLATTNGKNWTFAGAPCEETPIEDFSSEKTESEENPPAEALSQWIEGGGRFWF